MPRTSGLPAVRPLLCAIAMYNLSVRSVKRALLRKLIKIGQRLATCRRQALLGHRQCSTISLINGYSKHLENIASIPLEDSVSFIHELMPDEPRLGAEDHTCRHGITNACLPWRQCSAAAADAQQSGFSPVYVLSLLLPDAASPPMARATQTSRGASTHTAITPFSEGYNQPTWL